MIKISDKLWYVLKPEDKDALAYMCAYDQGKDGEPLSNTAKMQSTGRSWARVNATNVYKLKENATNSYDYERDEQGRVVVDHVVPARGGEEFIVDNTPTEGFYVGCSVSRWSTSNKLFRVKDPRGFTVEIPTDNLATLLHHTTVVKGVVQEACCWGREGNNHILLPVNSEPYLITLDQMDTLENKLIPVKDLKVGDYVKFFEDSTEYYYLGKVKMTWKVRGWTETYGWNRDRTKVYGEWQEIKDSKWVDIFLSQSDYAKKENYWNADHAPSKPKVVEVIKNEPLKLEISQIHMYAPQRITNQVMNSGNWYYHDRELIGIEYKK